MFLEESLFICPFQVILIAQIFGLFPVCGIYAQNIGNVNFKWTNFRSIHAVLWILCGVFVTYLEILRVSNTESITAKELSE